MTEVPVALAFGDVYRREYPGMIAIAIALTGDRDNAPDLVHDTMLRAFLHWPRVSQLERPSAWCHHVLVNICRSKLRRRSAEWRYFSRQRSSAPVAEPSAQAIAFWSAVRKLPERPRAVVTLYFAADLTSVQIAETLGIPEGTVRGDLAHARRYVMSEMREDRHV